MSTVHRDDLAAGSPENLADEALDPQIAELLAAYDEFLAHGANGASCTNNGTSNPALAARLDDARSWLRLLNEVWPRPGGERSSANRSDATVNSISGERLGRFEIVRELGRGGGGIVFLAIDSRLNRKVALKVPYPAVLFQNDLRRRFLQEAKAAAALHHRNIIPVLEAGEAEAICYIASEYCPGPTLAEWLESQAAATPVRVAANLVATLADAVEHAHRQGVLHRDLKPSNILLELPDDVRATGLEAQLANRNGDATPIPKLTDFGLAKVLEWEGEFTRTGAVVGTPAYMAPEQAEGRQDDLGPATDVYALGVILYELLTGRPPFQGESDLKTLQAIAADEPPAPPHRRRKRLPRDLEAICLKCLEKESARRYQRAAELADDLRRFLEGRPTQARPDGLGKRAGKWARRRPAIAALVAIVALIPFVVLAALLFHNFTVERVETNAALAIESRTAAERERIRHFDYAAFIQGAYQAWQNTDIKSAAALLDRCRPNPGEADLRGWEWYYVRRLCAGGILTLRGHTGPVRGLAFSPDGRRLASCDADGYLRIWDVDGRLDNPSYLGAAAVNDRPIATAAAHQGGANAVAYSPDGRIVATVGDDGVLRLWNAATLQPATEVEPQNGRPGNPSHKLRCVAFSVDGRYVAAAGDDRLVRIWDAVTHEPWHVLRGHTDTILSIAFAPQSDRIASGSGDRTARVWDLNSPESKHDLFEADGPVVSVAFDHDGRRLATGDSQIRLWDLTGADELVRMNSHANQIRSVTISPDGSMLASAGEDMTVKSWDLTSPFEHFGPYDVAANASRVLNTYRGHTSAVLCLAYSPQGNRLASGGKEGTIQIWDPAKPQERQRLKTAHGDLDAFGLAGSPVDALLALDSSTGKECDLILWDFATGRQRTGTRFTCNIVNRSLTFSRDGRHLAAGLFDGRLIVQDILKVGQQTVSTAEEPITSCGFLCGARHLAVASDKPDSVRLIEIATGEVLARVAGQRVLAVSPDDRLLATESSDIKEYYPVLLWDPVAGRSAGRLVGHKGEIYSISFSSNGKLLATGSADGTARIWDVARQSERHVLRAHRQGIYKVAFLMDGKSLVTASADGTVRIWSVASGRQLLSLNVAADGQVNAMAVSPDGRMIITASSNAKQGKSIDVWRATPE